MTNRTASDEGRVGRLLRQVFAVAILRCDCGGVHRIIAALTRRQSPDALRRYLDHIGELADPPPTHPLVAHRKPNFPSGKPRNRATP